MFTNTNKRSEYLILLSLTWVTVDKSLTKTRHKTLQMYFEKSLVENKFKQEHKESWTMRDQTFLKYKLLHRVKLL